MFTATDLIIHHSGLRLDLCETNVNNPAEFRVYLVNDKDKYQVFLDHPWGDRTPDELADDIIALLKQPPSSWRATWHPMANSPSNLGIGSSVRPRIAGLGWSREPLF